MAPYVDTLPLGRARMERAMRASLSSAADAGFDRDWPGFFTGITMYCRL